MLLEWTEPKRSQSGLRAATIVRLAGLTLSTRATDSSRTILSLRLSARAIPQPNATQRLPPRDCKYNRYGVRQAEVVAPGRHEHVSSTTLSHRLCTR